MKEFVVWGIPPGGDSEAVLYTKAKSQSAAEQAATVLEKKYGCSKTRVQTIDLSSPEETAMNDFLKSVNSR